MKTIIKLQLIAVLLSSTMIANGQPFVPVISSDSTSWDVAWKELFGNVMGRLYTVMSKDTTYHDLYFGGFGSDPVFMGKIREDAANGKLWYSPPESGKEEFLIMDLTLNVGDIFNLPVYNTIIPIEVTEVYYVDQKKYVEFDYPTQWDEPLRFIEGVGRNVDMFNFWFGDFTYVACKHNDGELAYMNSNPHFEGCELNTSSIGENVNDGLRVFPNPAKDWAVFSYIFAENSTSGMIVISDASGREVASMPVSGKQGQQVWDTRAVKPGVYFYTLSAGGFSKHGKIVISK